MAAFGGLFSTSGKNVAAAAVQNAAGYDTSMSKGGQAQGQRNFLFCIPLQVGQPTPYARGMKHWMINTLLIQLVCTILRAALVRDVMASIWMFITVGVGFYAIREDMNITYVCCWGMLCLVNLLVDLVSYVLTVTLLAVAVNPITIVLHIIVFLVNLVGAMLARHLYNDYAAKEGLPVHDFYGLADPFGVYVNKLDKDSRRLNEEGQTHTYGAADATATLPSSGNPPAATDGGATSMFPSGFASFSNPFDTAKATESAQSMQKSAQSMQQTAQQAAGSAQQSAQGAVSGAGAALGGFSNPFSGMSNPLSGSGQPPPPPTQTQGPPGSTHDVSSNPFLN